MIAMAPEVQTCSNQGSRRDTNEYAEGEATQRS